MAFRYVYIPPGRQGCLSHRIKNKRPVKTKDPLKAKIELHSEAVRKGARAPDLYQIVVGIK